jgi:MoaA/NifB/PqqE/SkfB family radical SAM enzyme
VKDSGLNYPALSLFFIIMLKIYRFLKFLKAIKGKKVFPRVVNYDINSQCNLHCEHCYWRKTGSSREEVSDEAWAKLFQEHKKGGATAAYLTGGEPAIRMNRIIIANRIFNEIRIISNGTIKIPESIQRRIFISIDGPKEIHNKIRRADVFDQIMDNIKDDKRVILTPTLSATNFKCIDELIDIAENSKVEGIPFSMYTSHRETGDPRATEERGPGVLDLLGFTHYWGRTRRGGWAVKRKTAKDRFGRALKRVAEWCRVNRHLPVREQHQGLTLKLRGHFQYYGIIGNSQALKRFLFEVTRVWHKWLNRRSQRGNMPWDRFNRLLDRHSLPYPRSSHPAAC